MLSYLFKNFAYLSQHLGLNAHFLRVFLILNNREKLTLMQKRYQMDTNSIVNKDLN